MSNKKLARKVVESVPPSPPQIPDVALAAIGSYKKQKEVGDFMGFLLNALDRNSVWLNNVVNKQLDFRCALLCGAGPNRFQLQEMIYPCDKEDLNLEVEYKDSEDYDKIAIAAILKLTTADINKLMKFIKNRLCDNEELRQELVKGKAMGINFALLRPITDKHFRVDERIIIGPWIANVRKDKKKRKEESAFQYSFKRIKRVA